MSISDLRIAVFVIAIASVARMLLERHARHPVATEQTGRRAIAREREVIAACSPRPVYYSAISGRLLSSLQAPAGSATGATDHAEVGER